MKTSSIAIRCGLLLLAVLASSSVASAQKKGRVVTISEVTIVGRVQKPIAAVDVSRIQPKLTLAELRQPFLDRIEKAIYNDPFWASLGAALLLGGWPTLAAWLIAGACIALAWRACSRLDQLRPPAPSRLLAELGELPEEGVASSERARRAAVAELNQRISDVGFELGLSPARFAALTRINLASGTALALLAFLGGDSQLPIERIIQGGVCAMSGFVGAGVVASLGRMAKRRVSEIRTEWDRSSREVGKSLGTAPGWPDAIAGRFRGRTLEDERWSGGKFL
jgi:hypothetical protein